MTGYPCSLLLSNVYIGRSHLSTLMSADVPMLYSPVLFQNASLHIPEIQCKEMKKLDHNALSHKGLSMKNGGEQDILSGAACYSIEVRDMYLPPWFACNLFAILGSDGRDFDASFTTESSSVGLNVALETLTEKSEEAKVECLKDGISTFGISDAVVAPELCSAVLKGLKYCNNSFSASLTLV
uniref:Uncharacterized protein n=1 Tax=Kalanchoe fedtschenkoi TaxID=63787 RepID=A0A7N0UWM1_KALFE